MELTEKQQQWLEDLVVKGVVTHTTDILNGMITLTLESVIGSAQLAVEKAMTGIEGAPVYVLHLYALKSLAQALKAVTIKGTVTTFANPEETLAYLESRPTAIIDAIMNAQTAFEQELKSLITPEKISENFSQTPGTEGVSNT
jgi:hypothetical protein